MYWLDLLDVHGTLKSLLQHHSSKASILQCSAFFIVQLSHPYMTTGKTIALTRWTFVGKVMSLPFTMLCLLKNLYASQEATVRTGHGTIDQFQIKKGVHQYCILSLCWLIGKDPDAGKDWRQEEKGATEDEMAGWLNLPDGHESEQVPGVGDGQGSLACCSPWDLKESDTTEQLNWTDLNF